MGAVTSLVVPCYNVESFLPQALKSIEANHFDGLEVVFVDDSSTDRTLDILQRVTASWSNTKVISHPINRGLADSRNSGIDAASGRFLTFMDPDDWIRPGYLAYLTDLITALGTDFVRSDFVEVKKKARLPLSHPNAIRWAPVPSAAGVDKLDTPSAVDFPYAPAGIIDTASVSPSVYMFDQGMRTAEDRAWIWRMHLMTDSYAIVPGFGYFYRRNHSPASLTATGGPEQLDFFKAYEEVFLMLDRDPTLESYRAKAVRQFAAILVHQWRLRERLVETARRELRVKTREMLAPIPEETWARSVGSMGVRRRLVLSGLRKGYLR